MVTRVSRLILNKRRRGTSSVSMSSVGEARLKVAAAGGGPLCVSTSSSGQANSIQQ